MVLVDDHLVRDVLCAFPEGVVNFGIVCTVMGWKSKFCSQIVLALHSHFQGGITPHPALKSLEKIGLAENQFFGVRATKSPARKFLPCKELNGAWMFRTDPTNEWKVEALFKVTHRHTKHARPHFHYGGEFYFAYVCEEWWETSHRYKFDTSWWINDYKPDQLALFVHTDAKSDWLEGNTGR